VRGLLVVKEPKGSNKYGIKEAGKSLLFIITYGLN
jgi:hypothetical protein